MRYFLSFCSISFWKNYFYSKNQLEARAISLISSVLSIFSVLDGTWPFYINNIKMSNKIMSIAQIQIKSLEHLLHKRDNIATNNTLPVGLPDAAAYCYVKQASFFSKKQQRWTFFLFQGLNTNPQNLSIYLIDQAKRQTKSSKQKLVRGVFIIYDLFSRLDVVIQINISGSCLIYKLLNGKKEMVNNEQTNFMYLSSHFRSMYQHNLPWGRHYTLFQDSKNYIEELKRFYSILFSTTQNNDISVGAWFEADATVKGSHACSLVFNYIKDRKLVRLSIQIIEQLFNKNKQYKSCVKFSILLAQFYLQMNKVSVSLQLVHFLLQKTPKDAYLLYYQSKYLFSASLYQQSLQIANSIVQYNQFQIWILLASIHLELKNFGNLLVCLNTAVKLSKVKPIKNLDIVYQTFEQLGKIRHTGLMDTIDYYPKLMVYTQTPLSIPIKQVQQKDRFLIEKPFWRLNPNQKLIYLLVQDLRYRLQTKKFEELLINTFQDNIKKYQIVNLRKGFGQGITILQKTITEKLTQKTVNFRQGEPEQIPNFLKDSIDKVQQSVNIKASRNLSIIPQIESVIQNSNYEQKQKQTIGKFVRYKRQVQEGLFKIVQAVMSENEFEKAEYEGNVAQILKVYNHMSNITKYNNFYTDKIFKIFMDSGNYNSIIVLIGHHLDFLEKQGVRKIDKLPNWIHKYLFFIIEEKGLKYLNDKLQELTFFDEAVIDAIEIAKSWKLKGITY